MLKMVVPTPTNCALWLGVLAVALIANTSRSGSEKRTALFQFRLS
jgi:hypothetical protein